MFFIKTGDFGVLVGDSGYPLRRYLLTPFLDPETDAQERYNKAQILTRVRVECCIGILKNRFRSLIIPLRVYGPLRSSQVITAMIVLHNIAIMNRDLFEPLPTGIILQPGGDQAADNDNAGGKRTRNHYVNAYFSWTDIYLQGTIGVLLTKSLISAGVRFSLRLSSIISSCNLILLRRITSTPAAK